MEFAFSGTWVPSVGRAVWSAWWLSGGSFSQALTEWLLGLVAVCGHDKERGAQMSEMVLTCQVEQEEEWEKSEVNTELSLSL